MVISYDAGSMASMPQYQYRILNDEDKIDELKKAFSYNCVKKDFFRGSDGFSYCLGYIGKSEDSAEWRVYRTLRGPACNNENDVDYIFTSFDKSEAVQAFNSLQGQRVVESRHALNLIKNYKSEDKTDVMEKDLTVFCGEGDWKTTHGMKCFVDKDGIIIRGEDVLIGRKFDEVNNMYNADTFGSMRSVGRAVMATNKSLEIEDSDMIEIHKSIEIEKCQKEYDLAVAEIDEMIRRANKSRYSQCWDKEVK
jgi:hypothetical protein